MPPRVRRARALLLLLAFAAFFGEGASVVDCPMHASASRSATKAASPATHAAHHHLAAEAPSNEPSAPTPHPCRCLHDCAGSVAVVVPEPITGAVPVTLPTRRPTIAAQARTHGAPGEQRRQPFATAPPRAVNT